MMILLQIDTDRLSNGGVEIGHSNGLVGNTLARFVGGSVDVAALHSSIGKEPLHASLQSTATWRSAADTPPLNTARMRIQR